MSRQIILRLNKYVLFSLALAFMALSCDNEPIQREQEQQEEDPVEIFEPPAVQLILNELETTELNGFQRRFTNFFDNEGKHISTDVDYLSLNESFPNIEVITYNANGYRASYDKNTDGFEPNIVDFEYNGSQLIEVTDVTSGLGNTYSLEYNNNQIIVTVAGIFDGLLIYEFSDNSFEQLISYQATIPYVDASSVPNFRFEYQYDSESNISQITRFALNSTTQVLEEDYTELYTYDDKYNPLRVLFNSNPLIVLDPGVVRPLAFGVPSHSGFYNNRNILSITRNYSNIPEQRITTFTYTYNEFEFPISSSEINTIIDTSTNEESESTLRDRTYTYYE